MDNQDATSRSQALAGQARDLAAQGRFADARACLGEALQLTPDDTRLMQESALLAARAGHWPEAIPLLARVVALRADSGLEGVLGIALAQCDRHAEAIPYLRKHLRGNPGDDKAWLQLAQCFLQDQQWTSALQCAAEADRLAPSERAMDIALECLGTLGMADEVEACLAEALQRYPASTAILAHQGVHLHRLGRIREGLRLQPMIRIRFSPRRPGDLRISANRWDGKRFDGLLLVAPEQGIGEEILGSSFFPLLIAYGQPAVVECDPRLTAIFARSFPTLTFLPRHPDNVARLSRDGTVVRRIKTLDLAPLLDADNEVVQPTRWLSPDPQRVETIRRGYEARWPGKRLVGVSWRSVRELNGRQWKSIPMETLLPTLALPDVVGIDVQYGSTEDDRRMPVAHGLPPLFRDTDIDPMNDLDGLLAQLCALDGLVTISNTTTHLAGAAGLHGDVILPATPPVYVYWGYDGEQSPLYPSLHLWRPQRFASLEALGRELALHLADRFARGAPLR